jgi:oxygen-dependent protoporphyrinogen oxidase
VVIGGGVTGLAAARRCVELDPEARLTLVEAGARLGGVLRSVRENGFLIEESADNFITNVPWALDLCRRVGFEAELIPTSAAHRQAKVIFRGRLASVPAGFVLMAPGRLWPMLATPVLSLRGKLRMLAEPLVGRRRDSEDESLASFARRRFGVEVFERLIQPLIGGIYTADPERLSLAATLPRFLALEKRYGSLLAAAARGALSSGAADGGPVSGARYGMFVAPREGMDHLVASIAASLPKDSVRLNTPVESVTSEADGQWLVTFAGDSPGGAIKADGVIVATPAPRAAAILARDGELAGSLRQIRYASTAIVSLGYRIADIREPLDAFGFVVPAREKRRILAASFSSVKYPGRAPAGSLLARVFIGGACQGELLDLDDERLIRLAIDELAELLGVAGQPLVAHLTRWPSAMPQYELGHLRLVETIEGHVARRPGLALAGAAYRGVGIPHCVRSGEQAAETLMKTLASIAGPRT